MVVVATSGVVFVLVVIFDGGFAAAFSALVFTNTAIHLLDTSFDAGIFELIGSANCALNFYEPEFGVGASASIAGGARNE